MIKNISTNRSNFTFHVRVVSNWLLVDNGTLSDHLVNMSHRHTPILLHVPIWSTMNAVHRFRNSTTNQHLFQQGRYILKIISSRRRQHVLLDSCIYSLLEQAQIFIRYSWIWINWQTFKPGDFIWWWFRLFVCSSAIFRFRDNVMGIYSYVEKFIKKILSALCSDVFYFGNCLFANIMSS